MKVLYLANPLRTGTGGDRRSFEVLKRIGKYGVEPIIVVDDFVWKGMKSDGSAELLRHKIYSVKRPNVVYAGYFRSASRSALDYFSIFKTANVIADIAKKERVELIVSEHEKTDFLLEAYFAAKKRSLPWTCVFQLPLFPPYASTAWRPVTFPRRLYMFGLYSRLYALAARALKSTLPLAVSASIELETKHYLGGWKSKMLVLHPGVGVDNEKMRKIQPSKEKPDAFFFSRLAPEKGIYDLPEIALEMAQKKPDLKFSVAGRFGSVAFQNRYENLVTQSGVTGCLGYKGFLNQAELYSLVKAAKVLVYPSSHDAFPLVVLETLACGTPVVAYDIPAITLNFPLAWLRRFPLETAS